MAVGVIAEYNPFHNGHAYQLDKIRKLYPDSDIVIAMSGDFVQRGLPAITDKYSRSQMALTSGADLILEIPTVYATSSAEVYAKAGITLLASSGIVDTICFGMESIDEDIFREIVAASLLSSNCDSTESANMLDELIRKYTKSGDSYPLARAKAIASYISDQKGDDKLYDYVLEYVKSPNNILAIEYGKAIELWNASHDKKISYCPIKREGQDYHSTIISSKYPSATSIRKALRDNDCQRTMPTMPDKSFEIIKANQQANELMYEDDLSGILGYRLVSILNEANKASLKAEILFESYLDCSHDLARKIINHIAEYSGFSQFIDLLKSKDLTYSRISRVLLHIILDIKDTDIKYSNDGLCLMPYIRVLGIRGTKTNLLKEIKNKTSCLMITNLTQDQKLLTEGSDLLSIDIYADDLYRTMRSNKSHLSYPNEYSRKFLLL